MLDALNITEEEALGLAEIAMHDLALARDFARRAHAAQDPDEANGLARSYQRAARSYRQTLALKARLQRDLAAVAQVCARTPPSKVGPASVARRMGDLKGALLRLAWDEVERPEEERVKLWDPEAPCDLFALYSDEVDVIIAEGCLNDGFGEALLDDHVAGLAMDLGYSPEAITRWRTLPDPPDPDDEEVEDEPERQSSA